MEIIGIILTQNRNTLDKIQLYEVYHALLKVSRITGVEFFKNAKDLWLVSSDLDAFSHLTRGALDLSTGNWEYHKDDFYDRRVFMDVEEWAGRTIYDAIISDCSEEDYAIYHG